MSDILTISLLGSSQITLNGRPIQFPSIKANALLSYLAVSGMLHDRAELAVLLWPESDRKRARGALRYTLSLIKKELGDGFLIINRRQIGMNAQADWEVDVVTVRRLLAPALGAENSLMDDAWCDVEKGVALYQADFLQGFTLRDSGNFNEWAFIQREAVRRDLTTALKRLVAYHQEKQQWETAVSYAHRWLNLDSLHEPAHCQLMQLYADSKEWTAVHNQYQSLTDLLERELGVSPQLETVALYQQLCQLRVTAVEPAKTLADLVKTPDQRIRRVLIEKMRRFWVNSLLTPLRDEQTFINLKLECANDAIDHPWADVPSVHQNQDATNIYRAFRNADRSLLILGAPGAGKTINLVELSNYLLAMADDDENQPVPVILNLSGWAGKQTGIGTWAVEEMVAKYQIPRRIGRRWLAEDKLLFLLDGLDEMPADHQGECITAINTYRQKYGLADVAVCCRQEAYETAVSDYSTRLQLNGAALVRPLTTAQIRQYAPPSLVEAIFEDQILLEIAQSPLNLNMMQTALNGDGAYPISRTELFDHYVQRMFQRQKAKESSAYSGEEMTPHLIWLARQMAQHNQSIFLIEQLQPSWLENGRFQAAYLFLTRAVITAFFGTPMLWSFIQLLIINPPIIEVHFLAHFAAWFGVTTDPWNALMSIFVLIFCCGLVVTLVDALFFMERKKQGNADIISKKWGWLQLVCTCGAGWMAAVFLIGFTDNWLLAISFASIIAFGFGLVFNYLNYGQSFRTEIYSRSALKWSWRNSILFGGIGVLFSFVWSGIAWLQDPSAAFWLVNAFTVGITLLLLGGLTGKRIEYQNRPNEGIRIAARSGTKASVLLFIIPAILVGILVNPMSGLFTGVLYGVLAGAVHGYNDVLKHVVLRLLLWLEKRTPIRYAQFLDCAADCVLLRKVGSGYTFRHRVLLDYFADKSA